VNDDLKPYPKMKDSGVPWLGEVPEHWTTLPLKRWVTMNRAVLPETTRADYEFRYLDIGSVGTGVLTSRPQRMRFSAAPSRARRVVRNGDTIVSTVRTYLKAIYFVDRDADGLVCSTGFAVLTPRSGTEPKFVSYLCQSAAFTAMVTADSVGIAYPAIAETRLGAFHVVVPPLPEQAAIVRFLDHADRRIRRYIRAKQKLIKLLEEYKQAVIHRAVTRGLDPNVRLKPSGVEWLGDVPEHWDVKPLKHFVPQVTVGIVVQPANLYVSEGIPCLRSLNISSGRVKPSPMVYISPESNAKHRKSMLREGDVVVVRTGRAGVAVVVPPELDGANCIDLLIVRRSPVVESGYLATYLNSWAAKTDVQFRSVGAIQAHYNTATLANMIVAMPPRKEQGRLLQYLDSKLFSTVISQQRVEREIELLREYRTRLIADVVTGKLDVREAAARLPQDAEEPEPLDEPEALGDASDDAAGDGLEPEPEEAET
jgi:type I restriction enzyme S subunit